MPNDIVGSSVNGNLLEHQRESVKWMLDRETRLGKGGILADDMGLGKTYQVVALIKAHMVDPTRSTLIVTVVSTLPQWQDVLLKFGNLHAYVVVAGHDYPIPRRVDVVLTTYSVFQRPKVPSCLNRDWQRIVLDEGHMIRTPTSRVCCELTSLIRHNQYRWIVSGTPIQNNESELNTLLTWVGAMEGDEARRECILRRTVPQVLERFPGSFSLPPIHTRIKYLFFRYPEERRLYFRISPSNLRKNIDMIQSGKGEFLRLILQQRQLCVHPMVLFSENSGAKRRLLAAQDDQASADTNNQQFCVPNPEYDELIIRGKVESELFHFQKVQLQDVVTSVEEALDPPLFIPDPNVLKILSPESMEVFNDLRHGVDDSDGEDDDESDVSENDDFPTMEDFENIEKRAMFMDLMQEEDAVFPSLSKTERSTKLDYLCAKLSRDHLKERKSLVFCQWKMEMKLIGERLRKEGIPYLQLDGDQKQCQRKCVLYNFENQPEVSTLVIQIRAGGVGLNLQAASRVYITSPDWNPVVELQAIARAHRINQRKRVRCTRLVMAGTVEEVNCLQKENVKLTMISRCLNDDDFANRRMGVTEEKYGKTISRICMHYHMLERLRDCDM